MQSINETNFSYNQNYFIIYITTVNYNTEYLTYTFINKQKGISSKSHPIIKNSNDFNLTSIKLLTTILIKNTIWQIYFDNSLLLYYINLKYNNENNNYSNIYLYNI